MKPTCLTPGCTQETGHIPPHGVHETYAAHVARVQKQCSSSTPVTLEGLAAVIGAASQALSTLYGGNFNDEGRKVAADIVALSSKAREVACGKEATGALGGDISAMCVPLTAGEAERLRDVTQGEAIRIYPYGTGVQIHDCTPGHLGRSATVATRDASEAHRMGLLGALLDRLAGPATAGEAVRAVHQRIAAMPADELDRRAEALAARDDAELVAVNATYNRAITDAQAALRHLFGPETPANPSTARAQEALQRLFRSTP